MSFIVIIPARLASTRLPNKPLADLAGKPMVVRVAERAALSGAARVVVATDHVDIAAACREHHIETFMTRNDHPSGTDRIAEVAAKIALPADAVIVNVQGDEPRIAPDLIAATAALVNAAVPMATAAHAIACIEDMFNPNVVKVVLDRNNRALFFSRAPMPWHRDAFSAAGITGGVTSSLSPPALTVLPVSSQVTLSASSPALPLPVMALRHVGLYAYRNDFLQAYPLLAPSPLEQLEALEQLRVLWHGLPIAVHVTDSIPEAGVDTPEDLARVRQALAGVGI